MSSGQLTSLVDELEEQIDGKSLQLQDVLDAWGSRSYGPLLLFVGLLAASPIGAIPGMSIVFGTIVFLIAAQLVIGRDYPWIPERFAAKEFSEDTTEKSLGFLRKAIDKTQFLFSKRLTFLAEPPADRLIGAACIFLAITFFPLALLPFAVFVPSVTVAIFGMALVTRDGLLTAIGLGLVAVCAVLLVYGATSFF